MQTKLLLPHRYKTLGYLITVPALALTIMYLYFDFTFSFLNYVPPANHNSFDGGILFFNMPMHNFTVELGGVPFIAGLLLIAFSREKHEDERISKIRLESLLWAVLINSLLVILFMLLLYGTNFLVVMLYNMCTPLIIFIARFNLVMYTDRKKLQKEGL